MPLVRWDSKGAHEAQSSWDDLYKVEPHQLRHEFQSPGREVFHRQVHNGHLDGHGHNTQGGRPLVV